jgi:hypothetical protein
MNARTCLLLMAAAGLAACDKPPVEWAEPVPIAEVEGPAKLVAQPGGKPRFAADPVRSLGFPATPGLCRETFATASGSTRLFAAWWSVRPDSSAVLRVAASPDSGKTWAPGLSVDTTDISSAGCNRPAPSIATVGDDVYLAYSMIAPEGKGVFFAHSMGAMLHSPVPVIYGERLVATAISADSHRVAVAYEEPNGKRPQVDVALSASQGHIFELHTTASRGVDFASSPAVAFFADTLAVSWLTRRGADAPPMRVVRVGRILP